MNSLRPYYKDNWDLLLCPTAKVTVKYPKGIGMGTFNAWWRDVDLPGGGKYKYIGSYSINNWTNHMTQDRGDRKEEWFWKTVRTSKGLNNIPVFGDNTWHDAWPRHTDEPPPLPDSASWGSFGSKNEMWQFCIDRHGGFVALLFMDWTVRKVGIKELWTLKWHREFDTAGDYTKAGGMKQSDWPPWMRHYKDY